MQVRFRTSCKAASLLASFADRSVRGNDDSMAWSRSSTRYDKSTLLSCRKGSRNQTITLRLIYSRTSSRDKTTTQCLIHLPSGKYTLLCNRRTREWSAGEIYQRTAPSTRHCYQARRPLALPYSLSAIPDMSRVQMKNGRTTHLAEFSCSENAARAALLLLLTCSYSSLS